MTLGIPTQTPPDRVIAGVLRHDAKRNSYKIALVRSLGDVALAYPDAADAGVPVAVPLRYLARWWIAYYWPFADAAAPILQGHRRTIRGGSLAEDIAFRPALQTLRAAWEDVLGQSAQPSDGYFLTGDMTVERRRRGYPAAVQDAYAVTLKAIQSCILQPIKYAGLGHWSVFSEPRPYGELVGSAEPLPGTSLRDWCVVVSADLWRAFRDLSLWVEALAIHQWCLYTEGVAQEEVGRSDRGIVYALLTARPDNRRPLSWERNRVDLILLEGRAFSCPWTGAPIRAGTPYDLDHLVPLAVYPVNDLWNLVPADPHFNSHRKRDRLPSEERLAAAGPRLAGTYAHYLLDDDLGAALRADAVARFRGSGTLNPTALASDVTRYLAQVADSRQVTRF